MKLFMITGLGSARVLASGKKGAFYNTLEEFHKHWERIDIIVPKAQIPILNPPASALSASDWRAGFKFSKNTQVLFGNVYIHISPWPLIFYPVWFLRKAVEIYKNQKFDLMTVHEFPPFYNGILARLLWRKIRIPYILEIFHIPGYPRASGAKEFLYKILFRLFIKFDVSKAKAVRVMNRKQVPEFLVRSGVPKEKIIYIPAIYVDLEVFKPMDLPKEYNLIFVGRLEKNKGLDLLLEAANKLKVQILNFKLIIVGDGPLKEFLKFKIENLKLHNNILLYGWAKDSQEVARLINKSKVLVMPSYNEGGPRVVLEAMACGVPVLAARVGIVPDIFGDGRSEQIIDWDSKDIATRAEVILSDRQIYEKYKQAGVEMARKFEKKEMIKNYAESLKMITK